MSTNLLFHKFLITPPFMGVYFFSEKSLVQKDGFI